MFFYFLVLLFIQLFFFWVLHKKSDCFGKRLTQIELTQRQILTQLENIAKETSFLRQQMLRKGHVFTGQCEKCKLYFLSNEKNARVCENCQATAMMNGTGG